MRRTPLVLATLLFLGHQAAAALGAAPLWADAWLDDLLFVPLVLGAARLLRGRPLPLAHAFGAAAYAALVFEVVLPRLTPRAVGDPLDAAAYFAGALLYAAWIDPPRRREAAA